MHTRHYLLRTERQYSIAGTPKINYLPRQSLEGNLGLLQTMCFNPWAKAVLSKLFNLAEVKALAYADAINLGLLVYHGAGERRSGAWRRADKALGAP